MMRRTTSIAYFVLFLCVALWHQGCGSTGASNALVPPEDTGETPDVLTVVDTAQADTASADTAQADVADTSTPPDTTPDPDTSVPDLIEDVEGCDPTAEDLPDPDYLDTNCDGMDGDREGAIFVAPYGYDENPGSRVMPMRTLEAALEEAERSSKDVYLHEGVYEGTIRMRSGVSIYGGYGSNWVREERNLSIIVGSYDANLVTIYNGVPAVIVNDIDDPTVIDQVEIEAPNAVNLSSNAIGVYVRNSEGFSLFRTTVIVGDGASGIVGTTGAAGGDGKEGNQGDDGCEDAGLVCIQSCSNPTGGAGGTNSGGCNGGAGGRGGNPGIGNGDSDPQVGSTSTGGSAACGGGGSAGTNEGAGGDGKNGCDGAAGAPGAGGDGDGQVVSGAWYGSNGGSGAGGCGGSGGSGGGGGGGSLGVFIVDSTPNIRFNTFQVGNGGPGGVGAGGGTGGLGGSGDRGGSKEDDDGPGGVGGDGGSGGSGGSGGGGGGGVSYGIYTPNALDPVAISDNEVIPGEGGAGGSSLDPSNVGEAGGAGDVFEGGL